MSSLKSTAGKNTSEVTTVTNEAGSVFTVHFDGTVDKPAFDEEDFSSSYVSTEI
jgi:hypothetical protein